MILQGRCFRYLYYYNYEQHPVIDQFGILELFRSIQCLLVLKLAPTEYATNVFSSN